MRQVERSQVPGCLKNDQYLFRPNISYVERHVGGELFPENVFFPPN